MNFGRWTIGLTVFGTLALAGSMQLVGAAPASATSPVAVTSAIRQGASWLTFSDAPTYANEPKVTPGVHTVRVTLTNHSSQAISITSVDLGALAGSTTCATAAIKPGKSGSCTTLVTVAVGPLTFTTKTFLSNNQVFQNAPHSLIGVSYDLQTTMAITTPSGVVSPGDPALASLPLGYRPTATLRITNSSTVAVTSVTVPGFNTQNCASALKSITPGTLVLCVGVPVITPASTTPVSLTTGAVGNGVFTGDRPGLGVTLSYQGVGGCTAANSTVRAGTVQTVSCTGFEPGITVTGVLHSSPVGVGAHTVAGDGTLSFSFVVPISTSGGSHSVAIRIGSATIATTPTFSVTAVPQLPETGVDPTAALLAAVALLVLGACALLSYAVLRERAT